LFWIYGGGFEFGSTASYDAKSIVTRSVALGKPVLYVAVNYRLGGFGFMAGKELAAEGSTNLGLRDQRLGLQWVQDNIAAFGGDPTKVTIWGESAGSISVFDHTIINSGNNKYKGKPLFRGAIMDSGSVVPALNVTHPKPQAIYDTVVKNAGCSGSADTLACLRSLDYTTYLNAANSVPAIFGYRSLDLSYLPRPDPGNKFFPVSPEIAVQNNQYAKVPFIIGDQEDEGTLFSLVLANITTTEQIVQYLTSYFPELKGNPAVIQGLVDLYPDTAINGSPFRTGVLNNISPQFKRIAAILGDAVFTLSRRAYLEMGSSSMPAWSYLSSYFYGTPVLGTFHASDIIYAYDELNTPLAPQVVTIQTYYISFVNALDPNALGTATPLIQWPKWTNDTRQLVNIGGVADTGNVLLDDTFREAQAEYLMAHQKNLRV